MTTRIPRSIRDADAYREHMYSLPPGTLCRIAWQHDPVNGVCRDCGVSTSDRELYKPYNAAV